MERGGEEEGEAVAPYLPQHRFLFIFASLFEDWHVSIEW